MTVEVRTGPSRLFSDAADRRMAALLVFIVTLGFYLYTLQPSLSWGDGTRLQREVITGESFILAELVDVSFAPDPFPLSRLGVAAWDHPLYVVIGYALVHILPVVNPLWLVNLISAVFGASAVAVLFYLCKSETGSLAASLFAALALAVSHTFWFHAVTPEVYTLFAFLLLLAITLYLRYEHTGQLRYLTGCAFVLGLGASNHLLAFLALPAGVLYLILSRRLKQTAAIGANGWLLLALAFLGGFSLYLIQFARMLRTFTLGTVMGPVIGTTFLRGLLETPLPVLLSSIPTYLMYLVIQFGPLGLLLGIYGLWKGKAEYPRLWSVAVAFFAVYAVFGILYRVSDQFAFFLGSYLCWALLMAVGVARLAHQLSAPGRRILGVALTVSVLVMPPLLGAVPGLARSAGVTDQSFGIPQIGIGVRDGLNFYMNPNKHGDDAAYHFGRDTMQSLPARAVVMAQWYTDTDEYFILRYFAVVESMRPDVELVGWPHEDPINFDSSLAGEKIEAELAQGRPVYLASLSDSYYAASSLVEQYCITAEHNLYRVHEDRPGGADCITEVQP